MSNRNRSWRRAQRARIVTRTKIRMVAKGFDLDPRRVNKEATTPHECSSYCCGNPRRWYGKPTMQEIKAPNVDSFD